MRTCRLVTLGCKVNQYETQLVKEALEQSGWREAGLGEPADLCVVNTCTVTREGDAKSRQTVRRLHQEQPGAAVVVMGCYATRDPEAVRRLPGVAQVITDKQQLPVELKRWGVLKMPSRIGRFDGHQRAFVKVQDGCLLRCAFCIIPSVRPVLRSRPIDEIRDEVAQLVAGGYQEVVLTGVHLGHYGIDLSKGRRKADWSRLWHLVRELDALPGDFRIRLSSLEGAEARDDLIAALSESRRVVPHLHLCLQSGSDRILARMKRRYRRAGFRERVARIRRALDRPAFTTDTIVGFPGETEADFEETVRLAREIGFCKMHVFSYSTRQGTEAAGFADVIPPAVIHERRERLLALERELAAAYARSLIGETLDVMVEGEDPARAGCCVGTSCRALTVSLPGYGPALVGKRVEVRVEGNRGETLFGSPVPINDSGRLYDEGYRRRRRDETGGALSALRTPLPLLLEQR
ncbi:MAG: tRNA (N(6)-L-threonylcarbamoyladenosine(37)-C(2))-methylthiotransferase MtaB [Gemmataceae bacterium]